MGTKKSSYVSTETMAAIIGLEPTRDGLTLLRNKAVAIDTVVANKGAIRKYQSGLQ